MPRLSLLLLVPLALAALSCERGGLRINGCGSFAGNLNGVVFFGGSFCAPGAVRGVEEDLPSDPALGKAWVQNVPGTAVKLVMRPVPDAPDGPMWVMAHELTWNLFDIFLFRLDEKKGGSTAASDAVTRPTKPYIAVDRGFGHDGYPAISMSYDGAVQFAEWMRAKTGRNFQIPTVQQWSYICRRAAIPQGEVDLHAWHVGNAKETTHPVGKLKADALGAYDILGNVAEWCTMPGPDGKPMGVIMGGGFESPSEELNATNTVERTPAWNDSDPQFPKSSWWLADAAFVGVRLICLENEADSTPTQEDSDEQP